MRKETIIKLERDAKSKARNIINYFGYERGESRSELHHRWLRDVAEPLTGRIPQRNVMRLGGYFEGLLDSMEKDMVYLYLFEGKYYSTKKLSSFPSYKELPREILPMLEAGHMYYKEKALKGIYKIFY